MKMKKMSTKKTGPRAAPANPYGSIQKAFRIVELLAERSPLGVTEIARELVLEKSSVSRLLKNLCKMGYARQDTERGKYILSPRILMLAHHYQSGNRLVKEVQPILQTLARAARASAHLGILVDSHLMIVVKEPSPEVIQVTSETGGHMPLHASALGKVILAGQTEDVCTRLLKTPLKRYTKNTITDLKSLRRALQEVRQQGYALEIEEEHLGVGCIAAPVRDTAGQWVAAVSVAGPVQGTPFKLDARCRQLVVQKADELSHRIVAPFPEEIR